MKLYEYWAKATAEEHDQDGEAVAASCWRWSDASLDDARRSAQAAAQEAVLRRMSGRELDRYGYGLRPLREEIVHAERNARGEIDFAVTRNAYGVLVLNAARAMFIDLDFAPVTSGERWRHFFSRLFGGKRPSPEAQREADMQSRLEEFSRSRPDWSLRVYRTFAGVRLLVTHQLFDPTADSTQALLESLGSDPLYVRLCRQQECFRARLTPKPWRCDHFANYVNWPHEADEQRQQFDQWLAAYNKKRTAYATCRLVATLGGEAIHPAIKPVVALHDEWTGCRESLPLA